MPFSLLSRMLSEVTTPFGKRLLNCCYGIGPKFAQLLRDKGLTSEEELLRKYHQECARNAEEFDRFLRQLGIRRNSSAKILDHLRGLNFTPQRITLAVEGNISAGKTTFLNVVKEGLRGNEELQAEDMETVPEPVDMWQAVGPGKHNLLDEFYKNPQENAYLFQNYVFFTRMMQERDSRNSFKSVRLLERSVFTDRMVFVRAVRENNWMTELQEAVYDEWFVPMLDQMPTLVPHGFIYLRTKADTCARRLKKRNRSEEAGVKLDYLEGIQAKHEDWLNQGLTYNDLAKKARDPTTATYLKENYLQVPSSIQDSLFLLGNPSATVSDLVKKKIDLKPALVLDCDADFDIQHDLEAKRMIADKVSAFVRFVRNDYDKMRSDANIIRNADVFRTAELEMYSSGRKPASVAFDRDARPEAVVHMTHSLMKALENEGGFEKYKNSRIIVYPSPAVGPQGSASSAASADDASTSGSAPAAEALPGRNSHSTGTVADECAAPHISSSSEHVGPLHSLDLMTGIGTVGASKARRKSPDRRVAVQL